MCGIIGIIGKNDAAGPLLDALRNFPDMRRAQRPPRARGGGDLRPALVARVAEDETGHLLDGTKSKFPSCLLGSVA